MYQRFNTKHSRYKELMDGYELAQRHFYTRLVDKGLKPDIYKLSDAMDRALNGYPSPISLWVMGPCVVGLSEGCPWWGSGKHLYEQFIWKFEDGDMKDTFKALDEFAVNNGYSTLTVGNLAADRPELYLRFLKMNGFKVAATQVTKEY